MHHFPEMRHRCEQRHTAALLASAVLMIAAAACGGSHVDKAGGTTRDRPLVLTLATHDDDYAYGTFAAAVARISSGSMRIKVAGDWRTSDADHERGIVSDVRSGKVPLGIVGVRVWDTLGVTSFQALLAPFLIDNLDLQRRALQSERASRALTSVARVGVMGVALLPGLLRRPFGLTRPLVGPRDYRGATIATRPGAVAKATFKALGGAARVNVPGDFSGFDGLEPDLLVISRDALDRRSRRLTGNVVLWPKPQTIVMNRKAFNRLATDQRKILQRAARAAFAAEVERDAHDERYLRALLCDGGELSVVTASPLDRTALRARVASVYRILERDSFTKAWITQIARMRTKTPTPADDVRCP